MGSPVRVMKLTRESIESGKTDRGGWTGAQLRQLGVEWPPVKGWINRLEGKEISDAQYAAFMDLRHARTRAKIGAPRRPPKEHADLFAEPSPEDFANDLFRESDGKLD